MDGWVGGLNSTVCLKVVKGVWADEYVALMCQGVSAVLAWFLFCLWLVGVE
jgi:hypothetical protein